MYLTLAQEYLYAKTLQSAGIEPCTHGNDPYKIIIGTDGYCLICKKNIEK